MLDVVCTRGDLTSPKVVARGVDFSDHRLLRWVPPFKRPPPVYTTTYRRSWRSFCPDTFIANLRTSELCVERQYKHLDGDALAKLYGDTITGLLDKQVSVRQVTCCRMSSNVWLDDECRRAKRTFRSMEKAARRAGPLSDANSPAAVAWLV